MQVYSPTWTGRFAIVAYAMACGITTAPAERPATTSRTIHSLR
jgi:hypothetical protein